MSVSSRGGTRKVTSYFAPAILQEGDLVNPFACGPDASAESNARASLFARAYKASSRKGIKQQRRPASDKLKVCLYIKQNMSCKRDIVGMRVLSQDIPSSTINDWWAQFQSCPYNKQRWGGPDEDLRWPSKALGRPVSIPKVILQRMDSYFELFREQGLQVTRELTRTTLRMVCMEQGRRLPKNLGASARAFLRLRSYTTRAVTHTAADLNEEHQNLMEEFRAILQRLIQEHDVAPEDILNSDETGIQVIPTYKRTLAKKGSKQVAGVAKKAIAQITKDIIVPFIKAQRRLRVASGESTEARENSRWAVLIWDNFSPHGDAPVRDYLTAHRVHSLFLPPRCTSRYQPLDVLINGAEKRLLTKHFSEWHFKALDAARRSPNPNYNVLPRTASSKRAFIATLIAGVHRMMVGRSILILTAWFKSSILEPPPEAMNVDMNFQESEDIGLDSDLLRQMAAVALNTDEEITNEMDEFTDATCSLDAHDLHEHFAEVDLFDNPIDEELEDEHQDAMEIDELDSDSDRSYAPSNVESIATEHRSSRTSTSHTSQSSCGEAMLTRPPNGGHIEVTFSRGGKIEPAAFLSLLASKFPHYKNIELLEVSDERQDGYNIKLRGITHGTVALLMPSMVWLPHELVTIGQK